LFVSVVGCILLAIDESNDLLLLFFAISLLFVLVFGSLVVSEVALAVLFDAFSNF
jgi:hypothetical protein